MTDSTYIQRMTAGAVLVVAAIAAAVSFLHIYHLAVSHGQPTVAALLLPVSVDGTVATASLAMLWAARSGLPAPWLARAMLGLGVTATLASNAAYGAPYGVTGELLSGWPGIAFVGSVEIALSMVRRTRKARRAVPVPARVPVPETSPVPGSVPDTVPAQPVPVPAGFDGAVSRYAADVAAGTLPGVRQIKREVGCGTPRAERILAHLTSVAEASS